MQSTLQENIYETIRERLTDGFWKPGEKLSEPKLAEELGVNRNPVREALLKLASEGLVERAPNMGCRVARVDDQTLMYMYQLREALETAAARLAAPAVQPAQLLELEHQNQLIKHYAGENNAVLAAKHDTTFHELLIAFSGNPILLEAWKQQRMRVIFSKNVLMGSARSDARPERDPNIALKAHKKIIAALKTGDPDKAEAAVRAHIATATKRAGELVAEG